MALIGFLVALLLFFYFKKRLTVHREQCRLDECRPIETHRAVNWSDEWYRHWVEKFHRQAEQRIRQIEETTARKRRRLIRQARRLGLNFAEPAGEDAESQEEQLRRAQEEEVRYRLRRRARAEAGYYTHLLTFLGAVAIIALVNLLTSRYTWFIWPTLFWGIGLFAHYMAVFGSRLVRQRYFYPAIDRYVRREKVVMHSEKQATIDELSASIAHEIRNPVAAAKSLVQQIGEDPGSADNTEYAKVAVAELDRVERRISHLLKYAKEEDYHFDRVDLAATVDSVVAQMQGRLDAARVRAVRNYVSGPMVPADGEKLRQVFTNMLGNAIDALESVPEGRRIDLFVGSSARVAHVRVRDNGCGIPAAEINRIFNPFFTTKEEGTGLGMAISKKIIEDHDGTINVVSENGCGAEFIVTLPLYR